MQSAPAPESATLCSTVRPLRRQDTNAATPDEVLHRLFDGRTTRAPRSLAICQNFAVDSVLKPNQRRLAVNIPRMKLIRRICHLGSETRCNADCVTRAAC